MSYVEKKKIKGINYYYIIKKRWDPKKKNSVKAMQIYLGTADKIEDRLCPKPGKAQAKYFGDVYSVYDVMVELGIDKIINSLPLSKKEAKLLQLSVINRATNPTSKNKMEIWFKRTSLFKKFSCSAKDMTSSDFTKLMKKVSIADISKALDQLLTNLQQKGINTDDVILDNTNYTTRLKKNPKLTLPQLGKSKNGKKGCLQINVHMLVSRDGKIPLFYQAYQGNINDPTFFEMNREKLLELGKKFNSGQKRVTLSLDAGHNSEDNINEVDKNFSLVGTLRPSTCKDLINKPSSQFTDVIELLGGETIKIYSGKRKIYGKEYTVVMSQFSATQKMSCHTLDTNIDKAIQNIKLFEQDLNATFKAEEKGLKKKKTKFHDIKQIEKSVVGFIKKKKHVSSVIKAKVKLNNNRVLIEIEINNAALDKIKDRLGRAIRFTNRTDMTSAEIVEYYLGQYMIEHLFRDFKDPDVTSVMPMFHRMDSTVNTYLFTNYLGLVILSFMQRRLNKELGLFITKATMLEGLREMKEVILYFDKSLTSIISEGSESFQKKMYHAFNLERYYNLAI